MLGHIEEWFYRGLLGLQAGSPGFRQIVIRPQVVGDLTWAAGHFDSLHGRIATAWKRSGQQLLLEVTLPANTTGTVYVPAQAKTTVTESGKSIDRLPGITYLRREGNAEVYKVGSGTYHFVSTF
jgi:alpha-L-rhamnosidase